MFSWEEFISDLSAELAIKGWPNYFLVTPATMRLIRQQSQISSGGDHDLALTHILGIPFEECDTDRIMARAAELTLRGKIVWQIDVGEQHAALLK